MQFYKFELKKGKIIIALVNRFKRLKTQWACRLEEEACVVLLNSVDVNDSGYEQSDDHLEKCT